MAYMDWNDTYRIDVPEVDHQHQWLFDLINDVHEAATESHSQSTTTNVVAELATMGAAIHDLIDYTSYHFAAEEKLMCEREYPEYDAHKHAHAELIDRVREFKRKFDEGEALYSMEIVRVLSRWLKDHILVVDQKLGAFLKAKAAAESRFHV